MAEKESDAESTLQRLRSSIEDLRGHLLKDLPRIKPDIAGADSEFRTDLKIVVHEKGREERWPPSAVYDLQEMAMLGMLGVSSILLSISRLVQFPVSLRSIQVLTRTGLEIAARNSWLLDPDVSTRERVIRAVAEAMHGTDQDARAAAKTSNDEYARAKEQWADAAVGRARELDLPLKKPSSGREVLAEHRHPNATTMIDHFVKSVGGDKGSAIYAYLSAATHGQPFHLVKLGGDSIEITPSSVRDLAIQLLLAVQTMKVVHVRYAQYLGHESKRRRQPYENVVTLLQSHESDLTAIGQL